MVKWSSSFRYPVDLFPINDYEIVIEANLSLMVLSGVLCTGDASFCVLEVCVASHTSQC